MKSLSSTLGSPSLLWYALGESLIYHLPTTMPVPMLISLGFALTIAFVWIQTHFFPSHPWTKTALPLALSYGWALLIAWTWGRSKQKPAITPFSLAVFIFLIALFLFNVRVFIVPLFLETAPHATIDRFWEVNALVSQNLVALLALYAALTIIFLLIGSCFDRLLKKIPLLATNLPSLRYLTWLGLGILVGPIALLGLAWIDQINQFTIVSAIIALGIMRWSVLWSLGKRFFTFQISIPPRWSFAWLLFIFISVLLALNLSETLRPAPTGYDDSIYYFDVVRAITLNQTIPPKIIPFETLAAAISIAIGESTQQFALALGVYGLFLGALIIFSCGQRLSSTRGGLIAATILLSTPMGPALALFETKPDSLLLPVLLLAIWFLIEFWHSTRESFLFLASLFLSLAISIKLTALFFLSGFLVVLAWVALRERLPRRHFLHLSCLLILGLSLARLPWFIHETLGQWQSVDTATLSWALNTTLEPLACTTTGAIEDFARFRYAYDSTFLKILRLPWDITMNRQVNTFATEIGFLFLAWLPFIIFTGWQSLRSQKVNTSNSWIPLSIVTISGLFLWGIFGQEVPWYFYPALAPLALLIAFSFEQTNHPKHLTYLLAILLIIGLLGSTLIRLKFAGESYKLQSIINQHDTLKYLDSAQPGFQKAMSILNADPTARIWLTNSRFWYGIERNSERAYMDNSLDTFACLLKAQGADGVIATWRSLGIRYILFNKSLLQSMEHSNPASYSQKIRAFTEFAGEYLRPVWGSPYHMILEIAPTR